MDNQASTTNRVAWAGIDLAKATFPLAIWGHQELRSMRVGSFDRTRQGCKEALAKLKREVPEGCRIAIVMEATGSLAETTAAWFLALDPSIQVAIVNPIQTSAFIRSLGLRNKTDDLDAKALAKYGEERNPFAWEPPSPEYQVLRDMVRARQDLIRSRTAMNLRLKDHQRCAPLASKAIRAVIRTLERQVEVLDAGILQHVEGHAGLKACAERMESIKGVGRITAATVLAELGDLKRFNRSRQLTAFAGLSPRQKLSGTSVHGRSPMCKRGSGRVRSALFMAAVAAVRFNPDMAEVYDRLIGQGKHKRVALGAVMRKLLVIMRAVVIKGRNWAPRAVPA